MEVTKFKATQEPIKALYGKDAADQAARRSAAIRIWLRAYQVHALVQRFRSSNHIGP